MYKQPSSLSQHKSNFAGQIRYNSTERRASFPQLGSRLIRDVARVFAEAADRQQGVYSSFVCTGRFLAKEYNCTRKHTTYLFKQAIDSGLVRVVKEFKYAEGTYRELQFVPSVADKIHPYLSDFIPPPKNAAVVPDSSKLEIIDIVPVFSNPSGLSFALEKNEITSIDKCMYLQSTPNKPIASKHLCSKEGFEFGKIYADEYLGYFKEFNEKKRVAKLIGQAFDSHGLEFMEELFLDLSKNIGGYPERRIKLADYLARLKNE